MLEVSPGVPQRANLNFSPDRASELRRPVRRPRTVCITEISTAHLLQKSGLVERREHGPPREGGFTRNAILIDRLERGIQIVEYRNQFVQAREFEQAAHSRINQGQNEPATIIFQFFVQSHHER